MAPPRVPADGIYVPSPTFFKAGDKPHPSLDVETQAKHTLHLAKSGITGVVLGGSTGEAIHLSRQERIDNILVVRKTLDDAGFADFGIMAGVLVNNTEEAIEWLQDAHKAGAAWGLVLTPGYFGPFSTQEGIIEWLSIVADKSPMPILIYNFPGVTNGSVVTPESWVKIAAHPNIVGCKMTHGNVSHHLQVALHPKIDTAQFRVFTGLGQQLGPVVTFGAAGAIDALSGIFPKTASTLQKLLQERPMKENEVRRLQWLVSSGEEYIVKNGIVGIREAIHRVQGFGELVGGRIPIRGKNADGEWEKWSDIMGQLCDTEKSL